MTASATPVGVLLLSVCTFFAPWWVVGDLVAGVTVVGLGLMWTAGLLVRKRERRAVRRWLRGGGWKAETHLPRDLATESQRHGGRTEEEMREG